MTTWQDRGCRPTRTNDRRKYFRDSLANVLAGDREPTFTQKSDLRHVQDAAGKVLAEGRGALEVK